MHLNSGDKSKHASAAQEKSWCILRAEPFPSETAQWNQKVFDNHHVIKFADDTVRVSLCNDTEASHGLFKKYFLIDERKPFWSWYKYKYFGIMAENKLTFDSENHFLFDKASQVSGRHIPDDTV